LPQRRSHGKFLIDAVGIVPRQESSMVEVDRRKPKITRVLIVDDHRAFSDALGIAIDLQPDLMSFFRTACYLPVLFDWVIVSVVFKFLLEPSFGLANYFLRAMGLSAQGFLTDPNQALIIIALSSVWKGAGYYAVFFLAALQDVPVDLKEAAQIDGANRFQSFLRITLPQIMPVTIFVVLISLIGSLKGFDQFYIMAKGGPARSTTTIMFYFYETAFTNMKSGRGAAIAVIFTAIVLAIVGIQRYYMNRLSGSEGVN
jgi:multiple sugar transport system permease protein